MLVFQLVFQTGRPKICIFEENLPISVYIESLDYLIESTTIKILLCLIIFLFSVEVLLNLILILLTIFEYLFKRPKKRNFKKNKKE